jgi:signal transduction histidine kinase
MNRASLLQQQRATAEVYRATQNVMWQRLGLGVAGSLAIALLAAFYAGRLEDRIRRQRARDIQNTRDVERLSMKLISAQEEERRSLARELHDEVGQALTAISVELAVAQRAIDEMAGPSNLLDDARLATDSSLQAVRDLSRLLHPAILDDLGLRAAIEDVVRRFSKHHPTRVELHLDDSEQRFAPAIEAAAYRTIQEALTNVSRHARANTCRIDLRSDAHALHLTIVDDGLGFDATALDSAGARRGLGLISIRERVTQVGGRVAVESRMGHGTTLNVVIPIRHGPDGETRSSPAAAEDQVLLTPAVPGAGRYLVSS